MTTATTLHLRTAVDVLATVPYVFGFHPRDSVVLLGLAGARLVVQARADADAGVPPGALADQLTDLLLRQPVDAVVLVGYGPAALVTPPLAALRERLGRAGIPVRDVLRADRGRYWSDACRDPDCCPADGTRYDPAATVVAAQATVAGLVAWPSRDDLVRGYEPVDGPPAAAMAAATGRAHRRLADLAGPGPAVGTVRLAARRAVRTAVARYRAGDRVDDDAAAWLCVLLDRVPVRDDAGGPTTADPTGYGELWRDLTRRAVPGLVPAPATLAGLAAWCRGEGTVAVIALDRALAADPGYRLALLLRQALAAGLPPPVWSTAVGAPGSRRLRRAGGPA